MRRFENSKTLSISIIGLLLVGALISGAFAHSGRTDSYGGHNNRKTGGYHYHNAGRAHHASNPYQDHKRCGICSTSLPQKKKESAKQTKVQPEKRSFTEKEISTALQAGLKCMGYKITKVDGLIGPETRVALAKFLDD